MRIFSIFIGIVYASVCFAQFNPAALENTLNSTFSEVVGYFDFIEKCQVLNNDTDTCIIMNEEETSQLESDRVKELEALNQLRSGDGLEPLEELPVPVYRYLKLDMGYTDFDKGRIKASVFSQTTKLDSNKDRETDVAEALVINADVLTDLTDTDDGRKLFSANANIAIEGNTLSVLKSIASVYGECEIKATNDESENADVNGNIICVIMDGFRTAETVIDLEKSIQTAANTARDAYGDDAGEGSIIGKIFSSLKIEALEDKLTISFDLQTGEKDITSDLADSLSATVVMTIREKGFSINATGNALLEIRQVEEFTGKVKEVAISLADRNSETHVTYYEDNLYLVFGLIEAFLVVEEDEDDDDFDDGDDEDDFGDDDGFEDEDSAF